MRGLHYLPRRLRKRYKLTKAEIEYLTAATISNYIVKTGHFRTPRVSATIDYLYSCRV